MKSPHIKVIASILGAQLLPLIQSGEVETTRFIRVLIQSSY